MVHKRRKGAAIVDTPRGILVVAGKNKIFAIPGGGAERWESRKKAAIRELYEETGLRTKKIKYLFNYVGHKWVTYDGKTVKNHAKVFLVEAEGTPKPNHEIKYVAFWKPGSRMRLLSGAKAIIETYQKRFKRRSQ